MSHFLLFLLLQLELLQVAIDIAAGMQHLHSKHIVHGDLNPTNVLLHQESAPQSLTRSGDTNYCASPDGLIGRGALVSPGKAAAAGGGGGREGTAAAADRGGFGSDGSQGHGSRQQQQQQQQLVGVRSGEGRGKAGGEQRQQQLWHDTSHSYDSQDSNSNNYLVTRKLAKIADFGLSVKMPANATHVSGHRVGTPFYVAPEVAQKGRMNKVRLGEGASSGGGKCSYGRLGKSSCKTGRSRMHLHKLWVWRI